MLPAAGDEEIQESGKELDNVFPANVVIGDPRQETRVIACLSSRLIEAAVAKSGTDVGRTA